MTLSELKQIKDSLDKGVIVSKATWLLVLEHAIKLQTEEDAYIEMAEKNFQQN